jgi:predicted RNase H-like nuclease (RuvC/YqgF family)
MKLELTRYQMEQAALALGARLKTLHQWRQRGWPANWLLKLQEHFGEPFDIVEIWTEQDHKRWLEGLDRARSQNVVDVYRTENERLKAENVELRRRLSNQQITILNLQQELGEDACRKIAVDKALALTRQAAVERAQFFVQQLQRDLQRCDMAQAQMARLLHVRAILTPCGELFI